ncbi:MAG: endonuclease III [Ruminococcaceae bacterium]|nr:endonuclease III [Oscillospiraceae bacterium]
MPYKELKERAAKAVQILEERYPDAICSLEYIVPHELMIATRLAAQCTDARVNTVTPELFAKYPSVEAFAEANVEDIEKIIYPCGFYRTKAADIIAACQMLRDEYHSRLPDNLEDLLRLPGIGRKTANLLLGDIYHKPAIVCDTHCIRICGRLGLTDTKDPYKCELKLRELLEPEKSNDFCHRLVLFGRDICSARSPKCDGCPLSHLCPSVQTK